MRIETLFKFNVYFEMKSSAKLVAHLFLVANFFFKFVKGRAHPVFERVQKLTVTFHENTTVFDWVFGLCICDNEL